MRYAGFTSMSKDVQPEQVGYLLTEGVKATRSSGSDCSFPRM